MTQVVYIDVLFAVNLIIDYFLLLATSGILHRHERRLRLFAGALIGAVYSLFIYFPQVQFLYSAAVKILASLLIVAVSFHFSTLRGLLKLLIVFYAVSFLFGGIIFAVWLFAAPPGLLVRNGVVYFDIDPVALILLGGASYAAVRLTERLIRRKRSLGCTCELVIAVGESSVSLRALVDTGNELFDAISGYPVVIAEYGPLRRLIPPPLGEVFRSGGAGSTGALLASGWAGRFRMIPYSSVGSGGLLPAFRPDTLILRTGEKEYKTKEVLVAVTADKLSDVGNYHALVGPSLLG